MTATIEYFRTAERPDIQMWLLDDDGTLIDLSVGYSFEFKLGVPGTAATFTKTTGIFGAAGSGTERDGTPNVTMTFAAGELDDVDRGSYTWQLTATTSSLSRPFQGRMVIREVIT